LIREAPFSAMVPILNVKGAEQRNRKEDSCRECWRVAQEYVERMNGIIVYTADENFYNFKATQIENWSDEISRANPTTLRALHEKPFDLQQIDNDVVC